MIAANAALHVVSTTDVQNPPTSSFDAALRRYNLALTVLRGLVSVGLAATAQVAAASLAFDDALQVLTNATPNTPLEFLYKFEALWGDEGNPSIAMIDSMLGDARRLIALLLER